MYVLLLLSEDQGNSSGSSTGMWPSFSSPSTHEEKMMDGSDVRVGIPHHPIDRSIGTDGLSSAG